MPFVLPTFNLTVDIYSASAPPPGGTPRLTTSCQLRAPQANNAVILPSAGAQSSVTMLLPPGTDIRDPWCLPINSNDYVEVPPGSGRVYRVAFVDDIGKGFSNEHRFAILIKVFGVPWPVPIP